MAWMLFTFQLFVADRWKQDNGRQYLYLLNLLCWSHAGIFLSSKELQICDKHTEQESFLAKMSLWDRLHELLFNIKHRNHPVMLRWVLWNNKLQNANKKKISLCLWVAFNFNWFIISGNCIFKLSWLPQLCLMLRWGNGGYRSRVSLFGKKKQESSLWIRMKFLF